DCIRPARRPPGDLDPSPRGSPNRVGGPRFCIDRHVRGRLHDRDRHRAEDGPRSRHPCDHGPRASVGPRRRGEGPRWSCGGVVANAGGSFTPPGPLEDMTEDGWRASVEGNLTATFLTIKSVLPGMKARKAGTILTMSSSAARRPNPRSPVPYAAAKAGIQILMQHLA